MQFHPLAYMVKLNIELSMADLIAQVARDGSCGNGIINVSAVEALEGEENAQTIQT